MAVKSKETGKYRILNDQTTPFNLNKKVLNNQIVMNTTTVNDQAHQFELPSVHAQLHDGDTIGLLIKTESEYYQHLIQPKISAQISGHIVLPKFWQEAEEK